MFWRIPAKIRPSQLLNIAAALGSSQKQPRLDEEQVLSRGPNKESQEVEQEEEEEEDPGEQRAQALRDLALTRKKKQRAAEHTGASGSHVLSDG